MDSAKEIAKDMLDAINIDGSGFWGAVAKGFISFPVSLSYMGYDFIDTEHRRENQDDKFRMAALLKRNVFDRDMIHKVIIFFIENFTSRIDMLKVSNMIKEVSGGTTGKVLFSQLTGVNLGLAISSRAVTVFFSGYMAGILLSLGAEASRAIYTSRNLKEHNPNMYYKLNQAGDLDLLYFVVEDIVKPFEEACKISDVNPQKFDEICKYFMAGL
ncbi:hypothetical protein [Citrobacter arsenatis]|uniref:hypothetical protein n=1 Tax=Citrobacter arsenatis TaxID=2546350 RepID=UPI00300DD2C6